MKALLLATATTAIVLGVIMYFIVMPHAVEQRAQLITQEQQVLTQRTISACQQLAKNAYMRDFIIICGRENRSSTASSTAVTSTFACSADFNAAVAYGVNELQARSEGNIAKLYSAYKDDVASCTVK